MSLKESEIIARVRGFIQENFLYMRPDFELAEDDRLLERGIVDSLGVVEMVAFVDGEFGIDTADDDISEANFGTLRGIARYVMGKSAALASAA